MNYDAFTRRFGEGHEIGRSTTRDEPAVFRDGTDVGVWRHPRGTTRGRGEVLAPDDAAAARHWFRLQGRGR